jgi:ferredoxin hydrogenase
MKKYICSDCGYIVECEALAEKYVCPMCGSTKEKFDVVKNNSYDNLDEIIDSVLEDALEDKKVKIINDNLEDKKVRISDYNHCIVRIPEKCINCGQCKKTCESIVNISYDLNKCKEPICIGCGQCILNCPTGALIPKYCYKEVKQIMDANEKIVVALVSPAVRVAFGESFGMSSGENLEEKIVSALKKVGFDYVFDTAFGADLTILEEVAEFASRLSNKGSLPQFTSCCPAWVKYAEIYHPEILPNLSSCKSPIGMQCAIIKSYFCEEKGIDPNKIVTVAITPCTAKKMEARDYTPNIDYVMTCSELTILLKEEDINIDNLPNSNFDKLLGESSGAGVMFGTSGGVCESVIRTLNRIMTKTNLKKDELVFNELRGYDGIKESTITIDKYELRVAVVQQMSNLEELLKDNKYKKYHFIEVMNCPNGCVGGGGQPLCPIKDLDKYREDRSKGLFEIDSKRAVRCAHDNKELKILYKNYLKKPLSEESFKLLHTSYSDKSNLLNE